MTDTFEEVRLIHETCKHPCDLCRQRISQNPFRNGKKKPTKTRLAPRWSRLCSLQTSDCAPYKHVVYCWSLEQVISSTPHIHRLIYASNATRITIKIIYNYMDTIYLVILIPSDYPRTLVTNLKCIYEFRQLYFIIEHLIAVSNPKKNYETKLHICILKSLEY